MSVHKFGNSNGIILVMLYETNIFYFDVEIVRSFSLGYLQGGLKNII